MSLLITQGLGPTSGQAVPELVGVTCERDRLVVEFTTSISLIGDAANVIKWESSPANGVQVILSEITVSGDRLYIRSTEHTQGSLYTLKIPTGIVELTSGATFNGPFAATYTGVGATLAAPPAPLTVRGSGMENDSDADVIRKHLSPALAGPAWDALIAALASGDQHAREFNQIAFDQLFMSSASGLYLNRKAADNGVERPAHLGMEDDTYRNYVIRSSANKLTSAAILDVLEVFYGRDAVRAYHETGPEPFSLLNGDSLRLAMDGKHIVVRFGLSDFEDITQARAMEVAAAITRALRNAGTTGFAIPVTDPETGKTRVRLYTGSHGLAAGLVVEGGRAINALGIPAVEVPCYTGVVTTINWNITVDAGKGTARFQTTTPLNGTVLDLSKLEVGDVANIYGSGFSPANQGSLPVVETEFIVSGTNLVQAFVVENPAALAESVSQTSVSDILFVRPTRATVHSEGKSRVVVSQSVPGTVDVVMPATSDAVHRGHLSAAYAQARTSVTATVERKDGVITLSAGVDPGLSVGEQIVLDDAAPSSAAHTVTAGTGSSTSYSKGSQWASITPPDARGNVHGAALLTDGTILIAGGAAHARCDRLSITGSSGNSGQGTSYSYQFLATASLPVILNEVTLTALDNGKALLVGTDSRAYLYDPTANTWTAIASPPLHSGHTATKLLDGRVLIVGGTTKSASLYDPASNTFSSAAAPLFVHAEHAAARHTDGRVFISGGFDGTKPIAECEIYDPTTNTWTRAGNMTFARRNHAIALISGIGIVAVGGTGYNPTRPGSETVLNQAEFWDRTSWRPSGTVIARERPVAVWNAQTGKVIVAGGASAVTEYFTPATGKWSRSPATAPSTIYRATVLSDGSVLGTGSVHALFIPGEDHVASRRLNGVARVTAVTKVSETLWRVTASTSETEFAAAQGVTVTGVKALPSTGTAGPYLVDTKEGVAVTAVETTLKQPLYAGKQYRSILVEDAAIFPDKEGYLAIGFGTEAATSSVRYFGRLSGQELLIDYSFKVPRDIPVDAKVTLLLQKGLYVPEHPEQMGGFYATASSAGRVAASAAVDAIAAAGINVNKEIRYPGDRGLGGEGRPATGTKISDKVAVWGGDNLDDELSKARGE